MDNKEPETGNKLKKKDIILILVIAAAALCLLFVGLSARKQAPSVKPVQTAAEETIEKLSEEAVASEETVAPEETAASEETVSSAEEAFATAAKTSAASESAGEEYLAKADEYLEKYPAESYLIIQTATGVLSPIPLAEEASFKVNISEDEYNIVHIGKNSVYMESSTCDNQNCVGEGEITLENRDTRVLYNMIVCLPHDLLLELVDADEARDYLAQIYQAEAEYMAMLEEKADGQ